MRHYVEIVLPWKSVYDRKKGAASRKCLSMWLIIVFHARWLKCLRALSGPCGFYSDIKNGSTESQLLAYFAN